MRRRAALGALLGATAGLLFTHLGLQAALPFWGSRNLFVLGGVAAGTLLGVTRLRVLLAPVVVLLGALWLAVAFTPLAAALASGLVRRDDPAPADAVVVLGSALQHDGELGATAQARLLRAIELLRAGFAPRLVITEWGATPPHAAAVRPLLASLGVEAELVVLGPVGNTRDEAVLVARLVRERGLGRVLVVTSPLHSLRTARSFERAGVDVLSVPASETRFDIDHLATPEDRLLSFGPIAHERVGLIVYRWRGWLP
jgi:uncharacterized SAM-binding protein YcdF (DUF218 family)